MSCCLGWEGKAALPGLYSRPVQCRTEICPENFAFQAKLILNSANWLLVSSTADHLIYQNTTSKSYNMTIPWVTESVSSGPSDLLFSVLADDRAAEVVAALQLGCEEMEREWGNGEKMRKLRGNWEEMEREWGNGARERKRERENFISVFPSLCGKTLKLLIFFGHKTLKYVIFLSRNVEILHFCREDKVCRRR